MIPAELLAEQLAITSHINVISARELVRAWRSMGLSERPSETLFPSLFNVITEIATAYGEIAAVSAADFYDEVREAAGVAGRAAVPASAVPPAEQVKAIVGWGLAPMREGIPRPEAAMQRLMGATSRLSLQPGRYTTYGMVKRDRVRYAHVPQGKSCAFCMMLASRGAVYWTAQPHYHSNCVTGDTVIRSGGPSIELGLRRWYEGELVILKTAAGDELSITPNHPVLTERGWVAAGEIQISDQIVKRTRSKRDKRLVPDEEQIPSRIEDIWRALGVSGLVSVPSTPEDFHGDGAGSKGDINVIPSHGLFGSQIEPAGSQLLDEIGNATAGIRTRVSGSLSPGGYPHAICLGLGSAPNGGVRGRHLSHALLGRGESVSVQTSSAASTWCDRRLGQPASDHGAGSAVLHGQREFACPSEIGIDQSRRAWSEIVARVNPSRTRFDPPTLETEAERLSVYSQLGRDLLIRLSGGIETSSIVHLERVSFAGHVYNLQTAEGWYEANNLIISNCDCSSVPVFSDDDLPEINQTLHGEWQSATWGQRDQTKAWREYVSTTYGVTH